MNAELEAKHNRWRAMIGELGILSLTRSATSMVMWAHYSSNSSGLCFGIDWKEAQLLDTEKGSYLLPLQYAGAPAEVRSESEQQFFQMALGRKHQDWAYESEVRFIRSLKTFSRFGKEGGIGLLSLNPLWVKEIFVGVMPNPEVLEMLRSHWSAFEHVKLGQLSLNPQGYRPEIRTLRHPGEVKIPKVFPLAHSRE